MRIFAMLSSVGDHRRAAWPCPRLSPATGLPAGLCSGNSGCRGCTCRGWFGPDTSGPLIAPILPDCHPTLKLPGLIQGGALMLLRSRLGFQLRQSDLVIMTAGVTLAVLMVFSF